MMDFSLYWEFAIAGLASGFMVAFIAWAFGYGIASVSRFFKMSVSD